MLSLVLEFLLAYEYIITPRLINYWRKTGQSFGSAPVWGRRVAYYPIYCLSQSQFSKTGHLWNMSVKSNCAQPYRGAFALGGTLANFAWPGRISHPRQKKILMLGGHGNNLYSLPYVVRTLVTD